MRPLQAMERHSRYPNAWNLATLAGSGMAMEGSGLELVRAVSRHLAAAAGDDYSIVSGLSPCPECDLSSGNSLSCRHYQLPRGACGSAAGVYGRGHGHDATQPASACELRLLRCLLVINMLAFKLMCRRQLGNLSACHA